MRRSWITRTPVSSISEELARRDLKDRDVDGADREELDARINEYYDEFSANGLENVVVKEPGDK